MTAETALAGLLGVGTGLGLLLMAAGLLPRPVQDPIRSRRWLDERLQRAAGRRVAAACGAAVVVGLVTRWPVGVVLAGIAVWWLPRMLGPDREHATAVARIEAIASWTESLRDTLAASAGLEQTLLATASVTQGPIAAEVGELAARLEGGDRLPSALRAFADDLADPTADLVLAALLLAAQQQAKDLGLLLGRLAGSAREQAGMRMRIAAGRARVRASVRIIVAVTVMFVIGLLLWSRDYLAPYHSVFGQLVLLAAGLCFAAAFTWLHRLSEVAEPQRVLTQLTETTTAGEGL